MCDIVVVLVGRCFAHRKERETWCREKHIEKRERHGAEKRERDMVRIFARISRQINKY
jgi:hypothetical protein